MLTEAALGGAVDNLQGLKENVILGHLIPAGSAFRSYLNMRIKQLAEPAPIPTDVPAEMPADAVAVASLMAEPATTLPAPVTDVMTMEAQRLPLPPPPRVEEGS